MNTSQDPWDQLHPMISLQTTEPSGFGNLNLRILATFGWFFDSARKQKRSWDKKILILGILYYKFIKSID